MSYQIKLTLLRLGTLICALFALATCNILAFAQSSQPSTSNQPTLEVSWSYFDVYSSTCKGQLHMRLYADGRIERERCTKITCNDGVAEKSGQNEYKVTRKEYWLSAQELTELLKFVEQSDFLNAESDYNGGNWADAAFDMVIIYRGVKGEKTIRLHNIMPNTCESKLPNSLNELFLRLGELMKAKNKL
jgi:hypothetical protein